MKRAPSLRSEARWVEEIGAQIAQAADDLFYAYTPCGDDCDCDCPTVGGSLARIERLVDRLVARRDRLRLAVEAWQSKHGGKGK